MSLSNTEAFAFTQIPSSIKKRWNKCSVQPETLSRCPQTAAHRTSMINSIEIKMDFDDLSDWYQTSCTRVDDANEDAILTWREHRELWSTVETAVTNAVDTYIKKIQADAHRTKNKSLDVPINAATTIIPRLTAPASSSHLDSGSPDRRPPQSLLSMNTGISPDDSASAVAFNMSDIRSIIEKEMRLKKEGKAKHRSHEPKKKGSKSMSLLSYAAGKR